MKHRIMRSLISGAACIGALLVLSGCATAPTGPGVMALPGTGKSFEQFRYDDNQCRQYARAQIDPDAANNTAVRNAAIGTAIGAVAGAAIGGHEGAGVGAGVGLVGGSMAGASESQYQGYGTQRQYDQAYVQCMYAKGHRVPVQGLSQQPSKATPAPAPAPAPTYYPPPPPPGWHG